MRKYLKEIFIIISIAAVLVFGSYGIFYFKYIKPNLYTVTFQDIDGVIVGSPVHFMGVIIGHVRHLKIKDNMVIVEIIVTHKNVKIPKGATIKVEFNGMGGSKSMEVRPPSSDSIEIETLTSDKPIRLADIFRFNKMYAMSMIAFEKEIKGVNNEEIISAMNKIPKECDFSAIYDLIDSAGDSINKFSSKIIQSSVLDEKTNKKLTDFFNFTKRSPTK